MEMSNNEEDEDESKGDEDDDERTTATTNTTTTTNDNDFLIRRLLLVYLFQEEINNRGLRGYTASKLKEVVLNTDCPTPFSLDPCLHAEGQRRRVNELACRKR